MKTISNRLIRKLNPCYDPSEVVKDENEELPVIEWVTKYRSLVHSKDDIVWLLCNKLFMSERDMRLFAVWCAREALKLIDSPDERSINACNVAERFANGEATKKELDAAAWAARDAAMEAAAGAAARAAAWATVDAAWAAAWATVDAAWAARAAYAVWAAMDDAARDAQIDKLLTYFEKGTKE